MMIDFRHNSTKTTIINGYKPFYIQKANSLTVVDTRTQWGMVAKTNPYPVLPTPKEPYSNNWLDEDGLDEYNEQMYYEPVEFDVSFYVKAYAEGGSSAAQVLRGWIGSFFDYVRDGEFRTYDSYTGVGYRKVRFDGYNEDSFRARDSWAAATITVKFKANDPTTRMNLTSISYSGIGSGSSILPELNSYTTTAASVANKSLINIAAGTAQVAGRKLSVYFQYANTANSPRFRIGTGTAYPIIHVPAGNFRASTYYLFEFTGSVWDCLGKL